MRRSPIWILCVLALLGVGCADESTTAFVDFNMNVDQSCVVSPQATLSVPIGQYDIAEAGESNGDRDSAPCANSYLLNLRVNSYLRRGADNELGRAEPNILQIDSAEVKLMTLNKETLGFTDPENPLPNPFRVVTAATLPPSTSTNPARAIATVEAIPSAYAPHLTDFIDSQILAEITFFGVTTGGVDVDFKPFTYAVNICDGCLTYCRNADILVGMVGVLPEDLTEGTCAAAALAGMDGRVCIDPDC
jgi:hypothetical protein